LGTAIEIEAVPAYNTTPERKNYHPRGRDNGYILTLGGTRIYIAGDTENIPEMKDFKAPDVAFLPVNQPYTMTVEQARNAVETLKSPLVYPYHYGDTEIEELVKLLEPNKQVEIRIRDMQ
jgi:L-ascorbate metabolism protein UlaG (beta-lactamase superfamily)